MRKLLVLFCLILCAPTISAENHKAMPATELFLFLFEPGPSWIAGKSMAKQDLRAHASYHAILVRDGRAFAGGGLCRLGWRHGHHPCSGI